MMEIKKSVFPKTNSELWKPFGKSFPIVHEFTLGRQTYQAPGSCDIKIT